MGVTRRSCPFFIVVFSRRRWDSVSQPSPQSTVRKDVNNRLSRPTERVIVYPVAAILENEKTLGKRLSLNERASRASLVFGSSLIIIIIIIIIIIPIISNGNRTEWSPIQSVIIRVINKIAGVRFV